MFLTSPKILKCEYCGKRLYGIDPGSDMAKGKEPCICPQCNYWIKLTKKSKRHIEIIQGVVYEFLSWKTPKYGQMLGQTMYILRKNGEIACSNHVWEKGKVPALFREHFPDTAYIISKKIYNNLSKGNLKCWAKGCYDRYHCIRYDYRQEFGGEPYNIIPRDWIVGNEHCPAFVNILDIKGYEFFDINDNLSYYKHEEK